MGVKVKKGTETHTINAPIIISTAGVYNTFLRLLPESVASKSYFYKIAKEMKPAGAAMSVFLGLVSWSGQLKDFKCRVLKIKFLARKVVKINVLKRKVLLLGSPSYRL